MSSEIPETRFGKSGDVHIAYQVVGDGPIDLVYVQGWISNVELNWQDPSYARFLSRLASFTRLITFDKRGTGLSDRVPEDRLPTLEQRMDDVRAVMDAAGSERAALLGVSEGGPMSVLFAATYPERTTALVLYGTYSHAGAAPEYAWTHSEESRGAFVRTVEEQWGGPLGLAERAPTMVYSAAFRSWWSSYLRQSASPRAALTLTEMNSQIDVRAVLPAVHVPTLVLQRRDDRAMTRDGARELAELIDGATLQWLPGEDHLPWIGDTEPMLDALHEFLTGAPRAPEIDRVLATVLFTDIVGSTERATELGDAAWKQLLSAHHRVVREELQRFGGTEIDTAGDGFLATFDGPARAVRCALSITRRVRVLGIEIRAGVHTGECERMEQGIAGLAVHIGARVASAADAGEVLVSRTVKDLVAGSGLRFEDRGAHRLKGVAEEWHLYAAVG
jgi:class 3 adenylate cyclase/pimeloyl-ACP methyl ester carboxylesterase